MEHNSIHPAAAFEGWYSKFKLPSGASLALIICSVHNGTVRPHMVSFNYIPKNVQNRYQKDFWVDSITYEKLSSEDHSFEIQIAGKGTVKCKSDSVTQYDLQCEEFTFRATTTTREPWSSDTSSPEGWLVDMPLPLHWHVHSLASECNFELDIPASEVDISPEDKSGKSMVHMEKNWANSFPESHIWLQAKELDGRGLCGAGGLLLGTEAAYIGYRNPELGLNVDFRPPWAARLFSKSPFMGMVFDWPQRTIQLSFQNWSQKLTIEAHAAPETFFSLAAPFEEGIRPNFLAESFQTTMKVNLYKKTGWFGLGAWQLINTDVFENAAMEFGGGYYPKAGTGEWAKS